jgi:hypothetical protein
MVPTDREDAPKITWQAFIITIFESTGQLLQRISENGTIKILKVIADFLIYGAAKIPYVLRCSWHQSTCTNMWRDVEYGPRERNRLDVYFPNPSLNVGRYGNAVILFVHGGAWYWGTKTYFSRVQSASFPDCTVVVINYTLHPHGACNEMVEDVSRAIRWVVQNICRPRAQPAADALAPPPSYLQSCIPAAPSSLAAAAGRDPAGSGPPLVVAGHSAGAHLVALALTRRCGLARLAARRRPAPPAAAAEGGGEGGGGGGEGGEEGGEGEEEWGWAPEEIDAMVGLRCAHAHAHAHAGEPAPGKRQQLRARVRCTHARTHARTHACTHARMHARTHAHTHR